MALFHGKSSRVAILSIFFHLSSLIPFLQPSNAVALTQRSSPPSAAVLTSPYVPNIAVLLSREDSVLTYHSMLAYHCHCRSLNTEQVLEITVHDTHMVITREEDGKRMPLTMSSQLITQAGKDIRSKIRQHGGNTPLLEDYEFIHRDLHIRAWQYMSEEEIKVTYTMVSDMITALRDNLLRIALGECSVDLGQMIEGRSHEAGGGSLGFLDDFATDGLNGTTPNSPNGANSTSSGSLSGQNRTNVTAPNFSNGSNGTTIGPLGEDAWEYRVPNTDTFIIIGKYGRRMPLLGILQLLNHADADLRLKINEYGGRTPLGDNVYRFQEDSLEVEAHKTTGPLTYNMVRDMVTGLKDCFWHVNYVESAIDIYRVEGTRPDGYIYGKEIFGSGTISFQEPRNRSNMTTIQGSDVSTA